MNTEPSQQVLIFRIGPHKGCFELNEVVQVYDSVSFEKLETGESSVLGILNIRGTQVPLIDIRSRWKLPETQLELNEQIIAFNCKGTTVSIIVDKVIGTKSIPASKIVCLRDLFEGEHPHKVIAVPDGLMLLLSAEDMFSDEIIESFNQIPTPGA